ncbi:RING finger protein unkempt homolog isoform X4 [Chelonus insularis]|uniref:RING finger protein unkempt homolog isoform X4 n=1 Tax=Chelonus insularis TaxID=460826 RepID=UPI00158A10C4|nr:RING finger protein unkempt homolog isoform X4 [Chelonus insularis]
MKSDSKSLLTAQAEKANHYTYLKEFRVEQCPLFIQRKCTQHRPFTCFNWHFMNQRRRRPVRKRDRTFNYSADNYCTKYDETTGICPDGDECPFLHRTAGDTERRYHLRYYKTCMCVHDTDTRGFCVKNGPHCAFAHGNHDLRPPVYDIKEIQALENPDSDPNSSTNGPNILDKERNLMNEDPKWQDTNYVLSNYKTEPCKRPPRLCRQGYACPQYHNSKDKRRSPRKYKYRSTPCPNVKHGEEWGEPGNCEQGDACMYCHTRTEQQFHPEIYKSTKCNDVQQAGYCPRGVFCAFAHVDLVPTEEMSLPVPFDCGTNLADILSNALPPDKRSHDKDKQLSDSSFLGFQNGSGEVSESASTSSLGSNHSHSKAPGAQLHNSSTNSIGNAVNQPKLSTNILFNPNSLIQINEIRKQIMAIDSDPLLTKSEKIQRKQNLLLPYNLNGTLSSHSLTTVSPLSSSSFYPNDTVESVVGNALDELHLDDPLNLVDSIHRDTSSPISNSISAGLASSGLLGSSAPVNIPGMAERSVLSNFSPSTSSPLQHLQSAGFLTGSRFPQDSIESTMPFLSHSVSDPFSNHISQLSSSASKLSGFNSSLFDFASQGLSPSRTQPLAASPLVNAFSLSPSNSGSLSEMQVQRLREELTSSRAQLATWDERINQARAACAAWHAESEEAKRKATIAEQQRDEALMQVKALRVENEQSNGGPHLHALKRTSELRNLSITALKTIQSQLRQDLEEVEKVLYRETANKCMVCEEQNRAVTLAPCNHYVVCATCAPNQRECPYCQTPVVSTS